MMPSLKVLIGLLVMMLAPVSAPFAEAQEKSADYDRVTPADLKWVPLPSLPRGAQIAVLHGSLGKPGLFTIRVKLPPHFKLPVHSHPDERVRTIISGTYYSAIGDKVDETKLMPFPPGTFSNVPQNVWQFAETKDEEVVFQISGIGPTGINYLNPADDPRKSN
jgi:quercetin dioxygenase-like cupin family protein